MNPFSYSDSYDESPKTLVNDTDDSVSTLYLGKTEMPKYISYTGGSEPAPSGNNTSASTPAIQEKSTPGAINTAVSTPENNSPVVPISPLSSDAVDNVKMNPSKYTVALFHSGNDKNSINYNTEIVLELVRLGKFDNSKLKEELSKNEISIPTNKHISHMSLKELVRDLLIVSHNKAADITSMLKGWIDLRPENDEKMFKHQNETINKLLLDILKSLTQEQRRAMAPEINAILNDQPSTAPLATSGDFKTIKSKYHDLVISHNAKLDKISNVAQKLLTLL